MDVKVKLTPAEVKQAVAEYVVRSVNFKAVCQPDDITIRLVERSTGQGMGEYTTTVFEGVTAIISGAENT